MSSDGGFFALVVLVGTGFVFVTLMGLLCYPLIQHFRKKETSFGGKTSYQTAPVAFQRDPVGGNNATQQQFKGGSHGSNPWGNPTMGSDSNGIPTVGKYRQPQAAPGVNAFMSQMAQEQNGGGGPGSNATAGRQGSQSLPKGKMSKRQIQKQKEEEKEKGGEEDRLRQQAIQAAKHKVHRGPVRAPPQEEEKPRAPEVSPQEKMASIEAELGSLKDPITKAGGFRSMSDFERKMFFENSMKILYRLDGFDNLGESDSDNEIRQKRRALVKAVKGMQDEAAAA